MRDIDIKVLDYLLDNDLIIMAEYDHPEEYDAEHWAGILHEGLKLALKETI